MDISGYSNIFQNCIENICQTEKVIEDHNFCNGEVTNPDLDQFWKEIDLISNKLSHECTKLCLSFTISPLPSSEETSAHLHDLECAFMTLVGVLAKMNPSFGDALIQSTLKAALTMVRATKRLLTIIKEGKSHTIDKRYMHATGVVWAGCDALKKCPKSQMASVVAFVAQQNGVVEDAYQEICEALSSNGEPMLDECDELWSPEEAAAVAPSIAIIKTTKDFLHLMTSPFFLPVCRSVDLDGLVEEIRPLSKAVDALAMDLYAPINTADVEAQSSTLCSDINAAVKVSLTIVKDEDKRQTLEAMRASLEDNLRYMKVLLKEL